MFYKRNSKIESLFFCEEKNFTNYIKSISSEEQSPWVTGCFYNNEIQLLIDINNTQSFEQRTHNLAHETFHLAFNKLIYAKYNIERVTWFDESYAMFLDGRNENFSDRIVKELVNDFSTISKNFDMNDLDDEEKVVTPEYNGYDMFTLIGHYIFENKLEVKYLELLKESPSSIRKLGETVLHDAVNYYSNKIK